MSEDNGDSILEIDAGPDGPAWAAQLLEENNQQGGGEPIKPVFLDNDSLCKLARHHLVREKELGAARSDIWGMLASAESLLALRENLLLGRRKHSALPFPSLSNGQKEGLLALAEGSLEQHCFEIPPLSAFIKVNTLPRQRSATYERISSALTVLLLAAAPPTTTINTKPHSNEVL